MRMATPGVQQGNPGTESIIAGYFQSGEDAHRAINALLDEGFLPTQIGAAFHTGATPPVSGTEAVSAREYPDDSFRKGLGTTLHEGTTESQDSQGGPSSDTTAVQPSGLSTGSGSPILGAGKPGPISGSDLSHLGLRSELPHELGHDTLGSMPSQVSPATGLGSVTAAPSHAAASDNSWTSKLKHLFSSKDSEKQSPLVSDESQNFGTGEGHMGVTPSLGLPYSQADFASSTTRAGVPEDDSRHLSHHLSRGGAVVTVSSTGRSIEVEKIFERHHGQVRFASSTFDDAPVSGSDARVEVFGHLEHHYPGSRF